MSENTQQGSSQLSGRKSIPRLGILSTSLFFFLSPLWIEFAFNIVMVIVIEGSGWPYWPPIVPNTRTVMTHTGIIGAIVRALYEVRPIFFFLGFVILLAWIYYVKYDRPIIS